jgi:acetylornithine deacetylase/succinyl-diaminopimelate desuccinylase-like protein
VLRFPKSFTLLLAEDRSLHRTIRSLAVSLGIGITTLGFLASVSAQTMRPDAEKQLAHDIYKEFVEIPSGFTTGATTPVAQAAAARLKAAGFPDSDIFLGGANPKKANLVVHYHGTGARKPLLLLAHIDVVEAKREDWSLDPFQLTEKDGYFYGRGTGDDKAQAAVWIANLIQYKKDGFRPDRDIIVALTADEEGGGPFNGVDWLIKNHRELIDADFALNEGGWGESLDGKKLSNDLQVSEKYVLNFRFEVRNKGGHSSLPVADNAIYHLAFALAHLSGFGFPLKTNEVTAAYFQQMSKIESGAIKEDLAKVATGSQEAMQKVAAASPAWNATLRTTCVATQLEGGHAINALPQLAAANVNCRVLPEDSANYVLSTLKKVVADEQVSITPLSDLTAGPASPMRPDVLAAVTSITQKMWPGVQTVPIMVMGATDGRYLRAAGIPTYGVQGFFFDRNDIRFHGRDERMAVQSFYEGQAFLYDLVKTLSQPAK